MKNADVEPPLAFDDGIVSELSRQFEDFDSEHPSLVVALALLSMRARLIGLLEPHLESASGHSAQSEEFAPAVENLLLVLLGALSFSERLHQLLEQAAPASSPAPRPEARLSNTPTGDLLR